jgi:UDP-perosamine 4-acetyltransferase
VRVDADAFVGAGATVLPRLHIGAGSVVGAGATVTADVPAGATVVGAPARPLT